MYTTIPLFIVYFLKHAVDGNRWSYKIYDFEEDTMDFYKDWKRLEEWDQKETTILRPVPYIDGEPVFSTPELKGVRGGEQLCMFA